MSQKPRRQKHPKSPKNWRPPPDDKGTILVRRELDEYGLNIYEFRVLAHVARRESKAEGCYASQAQMAEVCGISQRTVLQALKTLCQAGILRKEKNEKGRTNVYRLNEGSKWKHPSELEKIRKAEELQEDELLNLI
ncbi:helix-turn-helix domain-containing protein [Coleofasciculus sp. H7-2]|uniref:helix-turn-helix domain-containing protein n=1 Tax=Coleofasciculus sp. H7-2 TaxID=3351545 RepID=UPI0036722E53